ncbi:MAG: GcrA cell cycle regulator, partial [Marinibacterium sp.]|nr:GcrA cell cycle regulator [Marinibacterium sp.]
MSWTDERVELLKKMWGEGQSASQIAKELGGVTRNAVIGKVHRLGLSNRTTGAPAAKPEPKAKPAAPKPEAKAKPAAPKPEPAAPAPEAAPEPEAKPSAEIRPLPVRKQIIPAGQPLPPQPSANEISPEALAKVSEVEKKAKKLTL